MDSDCIQFCFVMNLRVTQKLFIFLYIWLKQHYIFFIQMKEHIIIIARDIHQAHEILKFTQTLESREL